MVKVTTSAALASEIAKGSSIEVDEGNYYLNSVKIGNGLKLTPFDDDNPPVIYMAAKHPSNPMLNGSGLKNVSFENIILDGNFANQPGATRGSSSLILVNIGNSSGIDILGCKVQNSAIDGFCFRTCHDILAEKNIVHDLGHEFIYALSCYGGTFRNNDVKTRTNSAFRISYGGSGFDIHDNDIWSWLDKASTGPGIELDKGTFSEIEIWDNDFEILNGAGVWLCGNQASCSNVSIHDNTFENVGQYYTTGGEYSVKYNGYSNGAITGAGFNGLVIEDNEFRNLKHCIVMSEAKHSISGNYVWHFNRNTLSNSQYGFRIDQARGSLVGSGNKISDVGTYSVGQKANVKLSDSADPIENDEDTKEIIQALINVEDSAGRTGTQTLDITTSQESATSNGLALITCKMSLDGRSGSKNVDFPCNATAPETIQATTCTGNDLLVSVKLIRPNGQSGLVKFTIPTTEGTGLNQLKLRTADGRYGEGNLNVVLVDPTPEPEPNVEPEVIAANITLENAQGWTGSQSLSIATSQVDVRKYPTTLITTKVTTGGVYGNRNVEFLVDSTHFGAVIDTTCTGNDLLATVELIRPSGDSGKVQFSIPTVAGTGYNIFKFRTPDGKYGESPIDIVLVAPPEPENPPVKAVKHTIIVTVGDKELIHETYDSNPLNEIVVKDGDEINITAKVMTDEKYIGELTGTATLRRV